MKIRFDKSKMLEKLICAMGAVSQRNTHPFTEGVLLETAEDLLKLSTYDMEKSVRASVACEILESGACVINAQRFLNIIRIMPENQIELDVGNDMAVSIRSGRTSFSLFALPAKDFPQMPIIVGKDSFTIEQRILKKMIERVMHSIAQIDQRPVLCGAYFKIEKDNVKVVSCDSYTLSCCEYKSSIVAIDEKDSNFSFIIPGKTINELLKMLSDEEKAFVKVVVTSKNIIFNMENLVFSSRLIEGEYLDYDRLIPKDQPIEVELYSKDFTAAIERASLISEEKIAGAERGYVKLSFLKDVLQITSRSASGNVREEIPIEHKGEDLEIGFSSRFLTGTMRAIESERVKMKLITPFMSMTIEPIDENEEENFIYMVLPRRMKE